MQRRNHWIFMIGPDGFPHLKSQPDGSTSAPIACANMLLTGQLLAMLLNLFSVMKKENSPEVRALLNLSTSEMLEMVELSKPENSGIMIDLDLDGDGKKVAVRHTVEFRNKADMKELCELLLLRVQTGRDHRRRRRLSQVCFPSLPSLCARVTGPRIFLRRVSAYARRYEIRRERAFLRVRVVLYFSNSKK